MFNRSNKCKSCLRKFEVVAPVLRELDRRHGRRRRTLRIGTSLNPKNMNLRKGSLLALETSNR